MENYKALEVSILQTPRRVRYVGHGEDRIELELLARAGRALCVG